MLHKEIITACSEIQTDINSLCEKNTEFSVFKPAVHVIKNKAKQSHYSPLGPREFWEVKAPRFRDIGT
jgi:hypothetical protein